jgi:hypothetical protein
MDDADLKQREERKREACWDPVVRWKVIQETITWAEAQRTVADRYTIKARIREQDRKLGR